ncbi:MAG: hypothetical protein KIT83_01720 [Bryobacterales bacterium]|nr:hypothetical protein [Bryobacterales bacterium]
MKPNPLPWNQLRVFPLTTRKSLTSVDDILVHPASAPPGVEEALRQPIVECAAHIREARARGAGVILMYGAHLLRNGAPLILAQLMERGWLTHVATNGAGTIHDWEYSWLGRSTESVRENVATGSFGAWEETGRTLHVALMAGALHGDGYGAALGRFIHEDGVSLPAPEDLRAAIASNPSHALTSARADLLRAMETQGIPGGNYSLDHRWKQASILAAAYRLGVPATVHPGIGYDIIANHPMFSGSVIGRAGELDFRLFGDSVETLEGGVLLSVGSAIMAPQVFEKSLSCVNNLRLGGGRDIVRGHKIYVVDLQEGGGWDWSQGEPPKTNPAYYLRFNKSFARMGGDLHYLQCDNRTFVHHLLHTLEG